VISPADIDVGVTQGRNDLGNRDAVGIELVEIDVNIDLFGGAAPRVDLNDTGHGKQATQNDPVLHSPQIGQPEMRRADNLVAEDLAGQARLLDLRNLVGGQHDILLQAQTGLGVGEIEIDAILEGHADERQTVERGRADVFDTRRRIKTDLHRNSVVALHFLGRQTGGLRRNFQNHRRGIGIGLDVQSGERK
jgi:hypothetical protein